ncbi:hypothetical protein WN944_005777 [Citrus x changshan-huyou]|uniref:Uncharacterized protein n=1 Tax=Citrus x changshan-huyou TaxID=2935761 RepID=A0AAP0MJU6_9ROSI
MEEQDCDASNCLGDPNSPYEGNKQVPLDVLMQPLPVDNWTNLERLLLFILICFEHLLLLNLPTRQFLARRTEMVHSR